MGDDSASPKEASAPVHTIGAAGSRVWALAERLLGDVAGKTILDLGAGGGQFASLLKSRGAQPYGCDLVDKWQYPEIPFSLADLDAPLPYESESLDAVVCLEAFNYCDSVPHVMREASRVLRPGGMFVTTFPNCLCVESRVKFLLTGTYRWFPHPPAPVKGSFCKTEYSDLGRDPVRVSTACFCAEASGLEVEEIVFGGKSVGVFYTLAALPIALSAHITNKVRRPERRLPQCICSLDGLRHRNVGFRAVKGYEKPDCTR